MPNEIIAVKTRGWVLIKESKKKKKKGGRGNKLISTFGEDMEFGAEGTWWPPCLHLHACHVFSHIINGLEKMRGRGYLRSLSIWWNLSKASPQYEPFPLFLGPADWHSCRILQALLHKEWQHVYVSTTVSSIGCPHSVLLLITVPFGVAQPTLEFVGFRIHWSNLQYISIYCWC